MQNGDADVRQTQCSTRIPDIVGPKPAPAVARLFSAAILFRRGHPNISLRIAFL